MARPASGLLPETIETEGLFVAFCYTRTVKQGLLLILVFVALGASAQVLEEDTTTNAPFFAAQKFKSSCYVGVEAHVGQVMKNQAGMLVGFNLNWVVNHKFVVSARYQNLTTRHDIHTTVVPYNNNPVYLLHHMAGLGFSYILFSDKRFSFQPELSGGWISAKFEHPTDVYQRKDGGFVMPAVYGIFNATKYFRLGVGLNYRAVIGPSFFGFDPMKNLSGVSGVVFFRIGTF